MSMIEGGGFGLRVTFKQLFSAARRSMSRRNGLHRPEMIGVRRIGDEIGGFTAHSTRTRGTEAELIAPDRGFIPASAHPWATALITSREAGGWSSPWTARPVLAGETPIATQIASGIGIARSSDDR